MSIAQAYQQIESAKQYVALVNAHRRLAFACLVERHNLVFDLERAIFSRVSTAFEATGRAGRLRTARVAVEDCAAGPSATNNPYQQLHFVAAGRVSVVGGGHHLLLTADHLLASSSSCCTPRLAGPR
jgi:hypothetical protein